MTVRKYTRIQTYDHVDYTRRIFMLDPSSTKALSMAPRAWRDMDVLVDSDDPEPKITVPYGPWDPDHFVIGEVMYATFLTLGETDGNGDYQVQTSYYIRGSGPSLTSPDKFWTFDCIKDPFDFAAISTKQYVTGRWDATPEPNDAKLPFIVCNDAMKPSRSVAIPHIADHTDGKGTVHKLFFVKIATTEWVYISRETGKPVKVENHPSTYCMLCSSDYDYQVPFDAPDVSGTQCYPSLNRLIRNIGNLGTVGGEPFGFTPSSVLDISISERSPCEIDANLYIKGGSAYLIDSMSHLFLICFSGWAQSEQAVTQDAPVLSTMEYYTGSVMLRDSNDDPVASLNVQTLNGTMTWRTIMDFTGIYTEMSLNGSHILMPEGKLPYVGSAWAEYAVAQRSYDRENMTLAIQNARSEAIQGTLMSAANGVLTGALIGGPLGAAGGAASAALGVGSAAVETIRDERTARKQQDLKEKMIRNSVGTAYNTGYGLEYVRKASEGRARIQIDMPAHLTQQMFDDYVKWHGYPAGGLESTIRLGTPGYIQGYITLNLIGFPTSIGKYQLDRANKELMEGVRFIDTA